MCSRLHLSCFVRLNECTSVAVTSQCQPQAAAGRQPAAPQRYVQAVCAGLAGHGSDFRRQRIPYAFKPLSGHSVPSSRSTSRSTDGYTPLQSTMRKLSTSQNANISQASISSNGLFMSLVVCDLLCSPTVKTSSQMVILQQFAEFRLVVQSLLRPR